MISPSSKRRRRIHAVIILVFGILFFLGRYVTILRLTYIGTTVLGPAVILHGFVGILFPATVLDPKSEFGPLQLWIDSKKLPFWIGAISMLIGVIIGLLILWS
jgi:hypothetical protein